MTAFRVVSDFAPAGDQPAAVAAPGRGGGAGRPVPDAAGHHRVGQVGHRRLADRKGAAAHPGAGPQQGAGGAAGQRVPPVLPGQPGGVLRLLLRLLPARGLHPPDRHLHREGLLDQRRDRAAAPLGHRRPADPPGRDHRGLGVGHLRPGLAGAVPGPAAAAGARGGVPAGRRGAPPGGHPVRAQRGEPHPGALPAARRHPGGVPRLRGDDRPGGVLRGPGRADPADEPGDRGGPRGAVRARSCTRPPTMSPPRSAWWRRMADIEAELAETARRTWRGGASCSRRSACACARCTTWR